MVMDGHWLTIFEYSQYRDISVSTIRRYIKTNKVVSKKEDGKFFIYVSYENFNKKKPKELQYKNELKKAFAEIRKLKEENNEMKMLINIYEEKINETTP